MPPSGRSKLKQHEHHILFKTFFPQMTSTPMATASLMLSTTMTTMMAFWTTMMTMMMAMVSLTTTRTTMATALRTTVAFDFHKLLNDMPDCTMLLICVRGRWRRWRRHSWRWGRWRWRRHRERRGQRWWRRRYRGQVWQICRAVKSQNCVSKVIVIYWSRMFT